MLAIVSLIINGGLGGTVRAPAFVEMPTAA
jgi:hypothetical protein